MKKLTKTTALILSAVMLFGCASNSANGGVGDTTPPGESSGTDSKNENSSADNSSEIPNTSGSDGFVKNAEGYQTFSYEKDKYQISSVTMFNEEEILSANDMIPYAPQPSNVSNVILPQVVAVKCRIAGDSIYFDTKNKSGDVTVKTNNDGYDYLLGVFTPVVIEEIIDSFSYEPDFKVGDTVYIYEDYTVTKDFTEYCKQNDKRNSDAVKLLQSYLENYEFDLEKELQKGNKADNERIDAINEGIEKTKQQIKRIESYDKYIAENGENVLTLFNGFPMQKGTEYFAYINATKIEGTTDNNNYYLSYCEKYNLGDDEPESLDKNEEYVSFRYNYKYSWEYLKEKYGEHFKK